MGVRNTTALALILGQREWQAKPMKQKDSKERAGICEIWGGSVMKERLQRVRVGNASVLRSVGPGG